MQPLEIIVGIVLLVAALIAVGVAIDSETVVGLGAALVFAALGAFSFYHGVYGEHAKFHAKHAAIYRDVRRQGFDVPSSRVFAVGGAALVGTEVDIAEGSCRFAFNATRLHGIWRVTLPRRDGNGVVVLGPRDVAKLAGAC